MTREIEIKLKTLIQSGSMNPPNTLAFAIIVLSLPYWAGFSEDESIAFIRSLPEASHFRENPSILFEAWDAVSRQIDGDSIVPVDFDPIFDEAA